MLIDGESDPPDNAIERATLFGAMMIFAHRCGATASFAVLSECPSILHLKMVTESRMNCQLVPFLPLFQFFCIAMCDHVRVRRRGMLSAR